MERTAGWGVLGRPEHGYLRGSKANGTGATWAQEEPDECLERQWVWR